MVARELVEGFGLAERQAATRLGIAPSAVSQYLSGKRLGPTLARYYPMEDARRIARQAAQRLLARKPGEGNLQLLLETAILFSRRFGSGNPEGPGAPRDRPTFEVPDAKLRRWIRERIHAEQVAVAECMRLAQRSRDELTRAVFRQIASDSLRHAEIVASLASYLDRGVSRTVPSGITRADVERLISRERDAEESSHPGLEGAIGGVMQILWESMKADEEKHQKLLELLLASDLPGGADRPRRPRRTRAT
jgi:transcriptional regulator with XRE-family HTH domain